MLLHVDESLESGYLFSLPRDLRVEIPAFPKAGFAGGRHKLTEAMSRGSRVPGTDKPDAAQGYELLAADDLRLHRDRHASTPGAVLTFGGLSRLTDAARRRRPEDRPEGGLPAPPPGRHAADRCGAGGGGYVGPAGDRTCPGTRHAERLAGDRLRPAALHRRRRLHPAAPPAAARQGAARPRRRTPGWPPTRRDCEQVVSRARRHAGLRRASAARSSTRTRCATSTRRS